MPPSAAATIEASIMPLPLLSVMVVSVVSATATGTAVRAAVVVGEWRRAVGLLMGLGGEMRRRATRTGRWRRRERAMKLYLWRQAGVDSCGVGCGGEATSGWIVDHVVRKGCAEGQRSGGRGQ